jgi:hypothetical protein
MIVPGRSAIAALILAAVHIRATALTAMLNANERSCYYADVDGVGEKIGKSTTYLCHGP